MTLPPDVSRRLLVVFHTLGLSCLGGAIFLQTLVFAGIVQQGYFTAIEQNTTILSFEVALTIFSIIYFIYVYQRLIRSVR
jgi:hypothetical protein